MKVYLLATSYFPVAVEVMVGSIACIFLLTNSVLYFVLFIS